MGDEALLEDVVEMLPQLLLLPVVGAGIAIPERTPVGVGRVGRELEDLAAGRCEAGLVAVKRRGRQEEPGGREIARVLGTVDRVEIVMLIFDADMAVRFQVKAKNRRHNPSEHSEMIVESNACQARHP